MARTSQQILDRFSELNEEILAAEKAARKRKRDEQKAERDQLVMDCAAKGHIFSHSSAWSFVSSARYCAACGSPEPLPSSTTAINLTKGA
jgi:hypothetical protein